MSNSLNRRTFLKSTSAIAAGLTFSGMASPVWSAEKDCKQEPLFKISLGEYSLHRALGKKELDHLDFAAHTKDEFGIDAVEYWSAPFGGKVEDKKYLAELKKRAEDIDVKGLLILVDGEGALGNPDDKKRTEAVENHYKWVEAAKYLGCHSIRVNALSKGTFEEQLDLAADGLRRLAEFGAKHDIHVIVENHGGYSSNGKWLAGVMEKVDMPHCGTLPDFGNFGSYDRYQGVEELMPFAQAVSAKSHEFDKKGNETRTDYRRMMKIVLDADYRGYVGIEYEGSKHPEAEGIRLTKALLETVRTEQSKA